MPTIHLRALEKVKWWEYVVRFAFGGAITAAAGLVARHFGPAVGGIFLAFPAILPASLTLVEQHDGRSEAIDDARGGIVGSLGLAAFALTVSSMTATYGGPLTLSAATLLWGAVSVTVWAVWHGRSRSRSRRARRDAVRSAS